MFRWGSKYIHTSETTLKCQYDAIRLTHTTHTHIEVSGRLNTKLTVVSSGWWECDVYFSFLLF